ncbi:MAG: hypothetical protein OXU20_30775 [Myxococcales bacterium]|nr:hypothetical protein [Myxococcales bacterium]
MTGRETPDSKPGGFIAGDTRDAGASGDTGQDPLEEEREWEVDAGSQGESQWETGASESDGNPTEGSSPIDAGKPDSAEPIGDAGQNDSCHDTEPEDTEPEDTEPQSVTAFYFGHSLLAYARADPNFHIPYNTGVFASAAGHEYETHGQLGWGTSIEAHWAWDSDDLGEGPAGFDQGENHPPFYAGRNGKAELASGEYNFVVFTDSNGHAYEQGAAKGPVVSALVNFIRLAREHNPETEAMLFSCWNEIFPDEQADPSAVAYWRDSTLAELAWWEAVTDQVNAQLEGPDMLLVPVSVVIAELAVDAAYGELGSLDATDLFEDEAHGTETTYYAAGAAVFAAMFQQSPVGLTDEFIYWTPDGTAVDYALPSASVAAHVQELALSIVQDYPRAGFHR